MQELKKYVEAYLSEVTELVCESGSAYYTGQMDILLNILREIDKRSKRDLNTLKGERDKITSEIKKRKAKNRTKKVELTMNNVLFYMSNRVLQDVNRSVAVDFYDILKKFKYSSIKEVLNVLNNLVDNSYMYADYIECASDNIVVLESDGMSFTFNWFTMHKEMAQKVRKTIKSYE